MDVNNYQQQTYVRMKKAIHIYPSTFEFESRILKEVKTLKDNSVVDEILILATWKQGLKEVETVYPGITVKRIKIFGVTFFSRIKKYVKQKLFSEVPSPSSDTKSKTIMIEATPVQTSRVKEFVKLLVFKSFNALTRAQLFWEILKYKPTYLNLHHVDLLDLMVVKRFFKNLIVIYDTHELETETQGCVGSIRKVRKNKELKYIHSIDFVIVVTPSIEEWYRRTYNISNIVTVRNVPKYQEVSDFDKMYYKRKFGLNNDSIVFLYQGALFKGRGIQFLLDSFAKINDKKYAMIFMGYGEFEDVISEYQNKYCNIFHHETVPPNMILKHTCSADIGVALTENICLSYYYGLGNKIFEYTMAEVPLMVSNMIDMANYVKDNNIGWVVDSFEIDDIVKLIKEIPKSINEGLYSNIKKAKLENNWELESEKLLSAYKDF